MDFTRESLQQGMQNQQSSAETPETFATIDGAAVPRMGSDLDKKTRMAGRVGARALELMNDPNSKAIADGWMSRFGMSNQGMQWNQAKMMMGQPQQPPKDK